MSVAVLPGGFNMEHIHIWTKEQLLNEACQDWYFGH